MLENKEGLNKKISLYREAINSVSEIVSAKRKSSEAGVSFVAECKAYALANDYINWKQMADSLKIKDLNSGVCWHCNEIEDDSLGVCVECGRIGKSKSNSINLSGIKKKGA